MKYFCFLFAFLLTLSACSSKQQNENEHTKYSIWNENVITANKYLVKEDSERISNYIKRRSWHCLDGQGGIKYMIFSSSSADSLNFNPEFSMVYRVELLDGTVCYTDEKQLVYPSSEMDSGLNHTFKKFCHGDSLVLILPPHYSKGLIGDLDKIPPHSVVVYYIKIK